MQIHVSQSRPGLYLMNSELGAAFLIMAGKFPELNGKHIQKQWNHGYLMMDLRKTIIEIYWNVNQSLNIIEIYEHQVHQTRG